MLKRVFALIIFAKFFHWWGRLKQKVVPNNCKVSFFGSRFLTGPDRRNNEQKVRKKTSGRFGIIRS